MKERNKDKLCLAIALAGLVVGLSACSHNTAGITVGTRVNAGLDPQNATANISYSDGLNVVDVSRENSTWQLEVDSDSGVSYDKQSGSVKGVRKIRRSIGPQITGYLVDLSESNPEAAIEYVKAMRAYWEAEAAKAQESGTAAEADQTASGLDALPGSAGRPTALDEDVAAGSGDQLDGGEAEENAEETAPEPAPATEEAATQESGTAAEAEAPATEQTAQDAGNAEAEAPATESAATKPAAAEAAQEGNAEVDATE